MGTEKGTGRTKFNCDKSDDLENREGQRSNEKKNFSGRLCIK